MKNLLPDAEKHPPATGVTPQKIRDSEETLRSARTPEERAAAEAVYQALCQLQNDQLLQIHLQRQFDRLTRSSP